MATRDGGRIERPTTGWREERFRRNVIASSLTSGAPCISTLSCRPFAWNVAPPSFYEEKHIVQREEARPALEKAVREAGAELVARHQRAGVTLRFEAVFGAVSPGLVERLKRNGNDLLVIGSHGRRGATRFLLGSVAEEAASQAPCSVLVAKRSLRPNYTVRQDVG